MPYKSKLLVGRQPLRRFGNNQRSEKSGNLYGMVVFLSFETLFAGIFRCVICLKRYRRESFVRYVTNTLPANLLGRIDRSSCIRRALRSLRHGCQ